MPYDDWVDGFWEAVTDHTLSIGLVPRSGWSLAFRRWQIPDAQESSSRMQRRDSAKLAVRLQEDLRASGFDPWLDTQRFAGGTSWTLEIERAIDAAQVVLALLSPSSYLSEICRAEQLRSLRRSKCVIPILAVPGSDIPLHLESKNYLDFTDDAAYATCFPALQCSIEAGDGITLPQCYRATPVTYIPTSPLRPRSRT